MRDDEILVIVSQRFLSGLVADVECNWWPLCVASRSTRQVVREVVACFVSQKDDPQLPNRTVDLVPKLSGQTAKTDAMGLRWCLNRRYHVVCWT